jgi:hypothetical protein
VPLRSQLVLMRSEQIDFEMRPFHRSIDFQPICSKFDSDHDCESGVVHGRRGVPDGWMCLMIEKLLL